MPWFAVAKLGDLKPGDLKAVEVDGIEMVLGRDGNKLFACQRRCPHQNGDLADGIVARGHVVCSNHGWRFSTMSGRHDQMSDVCLVTYTVRVNGDAIEIDPSPRTIRGF
jgi:nitrite reductase/ring-hydroxylating ferredoxin subunit